jgi:hypothetical protein
VRVGRDCVPRERERDAYTAYAFSRIRVRAGPDPCRACGAVPVPTCLRLAVLVGVGWGVCGSGRDSRGAPPSQTRRAWRAAVSDETPQCSYVLASLVCRCSPRHAATSPSATFSPHSVLLGRSCECDRVFDFCELTELYVCGAVRGHRGSVYDKGSRFGSVDLRQTPSTELFLPLFSICQTGFFTLRSKSKTPYSRSRREPTEGRGLALRWPIPSTARV